MSEHRTEPPDVPWTVEDVRAYADRMLATPGKGDPSLDEIAQRIAEIQKKWQVRFLQVDTVEDLGRVGDMSCYRVVLQTSLDLTDDEVAWLFRCGAAEAARIHSSVVKGEVGAHAVQCARSGCLKQKNLS